MEEREEVVAVGVVGGGFGEGERGRGIGVKLGFRGCWRGGGLSACFVFSMLKGLPVDGTSAVLLILLLGDPHLLECVE